MTDNPPNKARKSTLRQIIQSIAMRQELVSLEYPRMQDRFRKGGPSSLRWIKKFINRTSGVPVYNKEKEKERRRKQAEKGQLNSYNGLDEDCL